MIRNWLIVLAAVGSAAPFPAVAEEALYDMRGPAVVPGLAFRMTATNGSKGMRIMMSSQGAPRQDMTFDVLRKHEADYTVEKAEDRQITKLRIRVINDETTYTMMRGEEEHIEHKVDSLVGRVFVSELGKTGWTNRLAEGEPTEENSKSLKLQASFDDENRYPKDKVPIGATWTMPPDNITRSYTGEYRDAKVTGELKSKFVAVRNLDGEPCAMIETKGPVRGTFRREGKEANLDLDIAMTEFRSLRNHLVLSLEVRCEMKLWGPITVGNEDWEQVITGTVDSTYRTRPLK